MNSLITEKDIVKRIYTIRGKRVMLDKDLAELYGVETKVLNQAVKRNLTRFPEDFMFQLTEIEFDILRSQFVTSNAGGRRYLPFMFTEQGVSMLASVLNSEQAIQVNIQIVRAFVKMRELLSTSNAMEDKIEKIEKKLLKQGHSVKEHTRQIAMIFSAIKQLLHEDEEESKTKKIGFGDNK